MTTARTRSTRVQMSEKFEQLLRPKKVYFTTKWCKQGWGWSWTDDLKKRAIDRIRDYANESLIIFDDILTFRDGNAFVRLLEANTQQHQFLLCEFDLLTKKSFNFGAPSTAGPLRAIDVPLTPLPNIDPGHLPSPQVCRFCRFLDRFSSEHGLVRLDLLIESARTLDDLIEWLDIPGEGGYAALVHGYANVLPHFRWYLYEKIRSEFPDVTEGRNVNARTIFQKFLIKDENGNDENLGENNTPPPNQPDDRDLRNLRQATLAAFNAKHTFLFETRTDPIVRTTVGLDPDRTSKHQRWNGYFKDFTASFKKEADIKRFLQSKRLPQGVRTRLQTYLTAEHHTHDIPLITLAQFLQSKVDDGGQQNKTVSGITFLANKEKWPVVHQKERTVQTQRVVNQIIKQYNKRLQPPTQQLPRPQQVLHQDAKKLRSDLKTLADHVDTESKISFQSYQNAFKLEQNLLKEFTSKIIRMPREIGRAHV